MDDKQKNIALAGVSIFVVLMGWGQIKEHLVSRDEYASIQYQVGELRDATRRNALAIENTARDADRKIIELEQRIVKHIERSGDKVIQQVGEKLDFIEKYTRQVIEDQSRRANNSENTFLNKVQTLESRVLDLERNTNTSIYLKPKTNIIK